LGWTPEVILKTPIPMLELALAGKADFIKKTNPWGSGDGDKTPQPADQAKNLLEHLLNHPSAKPLPKRRKRG
jgi:hypothetical protein